MSKVFLACHVVFNTKYHKRTIPFELRRIIYAYIHTFLKSKNCKTYRINGSVDHIHIVLNLHPSIALSDLVRLLKTESSKIFRDDERFPDFEGWGDGYYCHSISVECLDAAIEYVKNQEKHHTVDNEDFMSEMRWMVGKHGMRWYEDDWN